MGRRGDVPLGAAAAVFAGAFWGLTNAVGTIWYIGRPPAAGGLTGYVSAHGEHWWVLPLFAVFLGAGLVCGGLAAALLADPGEGARWGARWVLVGLAAAPSAAIVLQSLGAINVFALGTEPSIATPAPMHWFGSLVS